MIKIFICFGSRFALRCRGQNSEREVMAPERFILNLGEKRIFHPQLKRFRTLESRRTSRSQSPGSDSRAPTAAEPADAAENRWEDC